MLCDIECRAGSAQCFTPIGTSSEKTNLALVRIDVIKDAQQISPLGESVLSFIVQFVREREHGRLDCDLSGVPVFREHPGGC